VIVLRSIQRIRWWWRWRWHEDDNISFSPFFR